MLSKKRNREGPCFEAEETVSVDAVSEMDLDLSTSSTTLFSLSLEQLKIAASIAQDRLSRALFVDIELFDLTLKYGGLTAPLAASQSIPLKNTLMETPTRKSVILEPMTEQSTLRTRNFLGSFKFTKEMQDVSMHTLDFKPKDRVPKVISHLTKTILELSSNEPLGLFVRNPSQSRLCSIQEQVSAIGIKDTLKLAIQSDVVELGAYLMDTLSSQPPLIPISLQPVFKSILALNQATGTKGRLSLRIPNATIKKHLRDGLLLLPIGYRDTLHHLLEFACKSCQFNSISLQDISKALGSCIFSSTSTWSCLLFELFMYAHGYTSLPTQSQSDLWRIPSSFEKEISERLGVLKTPRRNLNVTPRRAALSKSSTASTRRLFTRAPPLASRNLFAPVLSVNFVRDECDVDAELKRDEYSKRRRVF